MLCWAAFLPAIQYGVKTTNCTISRDPYDRARLVSVNR